MKFQSVLKVLSGLVFTFPSVYAKSQDYARHLELSLLFYEAQRSGPLPASNRIFWRKDSMTDAGADNGVDLNGGCKYYDAGDNVKFNFPQAGALTLLAFSAYKWQEGYKEAEQWEYIKDAIKWGTDYFIKCHTGKNELYGQVGNGSLDHGEWVAPEDMTYEHPSYKIDASAPGSDLAAETAASLAAAYLVFKDDDPAYAATCLKHAKELYEFADKYQDTYTTGIPDAQGYYRSYSGFKDELVWGAAMLLLATGDESYRAKADAIWDYPYNKHDPDYFLNSGGPISWDDKKACSYALMYMVTGEDKYKEQAFNHSDLMVNYKTTPGGLWFDTNLSAWGSNRYASNAAYTVAMVASTMDASDAKRKQYVKFIQKQIDYIQGDNPAKVDYVVGADPSSPKSVHHRGSSGTMNAMAEPPFNVFPLYGALAGGPDGNDKYTDDRTNYNSNEVALDYNAAYTGLLAFLIQEGLNVPDPEQTWEGAWPPKEKDGEINLKLNFNGSNEFTPTVSTTGGLTCGGWCVEMDLTSTGATLDNVWGGELLKQEGNKFVACAGWGKGYLDGKGTEQNFYFRVKPNGSMKEPTEAFVYCNGYNRGDKYLVKVNGGGSEPYGWTKGICKPAHICDANGNYIKDSGVINKSTSGGSSPKTKTTTIKKTTTKAAEPTSPSSSCFATKLGYGCCTGCEVNYTDDDGAWGIENGNWCGIPDSCNKEPEPEPVKDECFATKLGYDCCSGCDVNYTDGDGAWGIENGNWCGIKDSCSSTPSTKCFSEPDYPCCPSGTATVYTDESGAWGVINNDWCGISA
ncbi:Six-hairpin glycosidase-like protein [Neocallimastix sp. 'constans']